MNFGYWAVPDFYVAVTKRFTAVAIYMYMYLSCCIAIQTLKYRLKKGWGSVAKDSKEEISEAECLPSRLHSVWKSKQDDHNTEHSNVVRARIISLNQIELAWCHSLVCCQSS